MAYLNGGGGRWCDCPPPWSDHNFCALFCKIRFMTEPYNPRPKASSDCPCFLPVKNKMCKNAIKCIILGKKMIFFSGGIQPAPPYPTPQGTNHTSPPPLLLNPEYATANIRYATSIQHTRQSCQDCLQSARTSGPRRTPAPPPQCRRRRRRHPPSQALE